VRMYPNPASGGEVTLVQSNAGGDWVARIRDAQGREVALHRGTGPQSTLNVRSLPAGMYVIDVEAWGWRQPLILR
jgi:hypothetical protein